MVIEAEVHLAVKDGKPRDPREKKIKGGEEEENKQKLRYPEGA